MTPTIEITDFDKPIKVVDGDSFVLSVRGKEVCRKTMAAIDTITCWAYVSIPGIGDAYFLGNDGLQDYLFKTLRAH